VIISVDFSATGQLLIVYPSCKILEDNWDYNVAVHQLLIDFKKTYDSVGMDVLLNILIEFGIRMQLVRLITMCE